MLELSVNSIVVDKSLLSPARQPQIRGVQTGCAMVSACAWLSRGQNRDSRQLQSPSLRVRCTPRAYDPAPAGSSWHAPWPAPRSTRPETECPPRLGGENPASPTSTCHPFQGMADHADPPGRVIAPGCLATESPTRRQAGESLRTFRSQGSPNEHGLPFSDNQSLQGARYD